VTHARAADGRRRKFRPSRLQLHPAGLAGANGGVRLAIVEATAVGLGLEVIEGVSFHGIAGAQRMHGTIVGDATGERAGAEREEEQDNGFHGRGGSRREGAMATWAKFRANARKYRVGA